MANDLGILAARIEASLSVIMRGINPDVRGDPLAHLPLAQLRLLRALKRGARTPSQLSEALGVSLSAVTQMTNRLVAGGLVERVQDAEDRRVRRLHLKPKGSRLLRERRLRRVAGVEGLLVLLTPDERCAVAEGFSILARASQSKHERTAPESLAALAELEPRFVPAMENPI